MAQNALTVTPPNPTPPTNMSFLGTTPPVAPAQPAADDGAAGTLTVFASKTASVDNTNFPSVDAEGKGTETVVTISTNVNAPLVTFSDLGAYTSTPSASHASTLSGNSVPTNSAASGASNVSGAGTTLLTVTGTNFNRGSIVNLNGIPQQTNYVSATSLTVTNAQKKATAGTLPVSVTSNGNTTTPVNWTFT